MRPIDADALLFELANESFPQSCTYAQGRNGVIESIRNAPTVDAVPVIRCKDCKYYEPYTEMFTNKPRGDGSCTRARMTQDGLQEINCEDDEFCSYGERKDDEAD